MEILFKTALTVNLNLPMIQILQEIFKFGLWSNFVFNAQSVIYISVALLV